MNTETECNCCPLETCCPSQCSSRPHVSYKNRAERPLKEEAVCSAKNCSIFGGHDSAPLPEYPCHQKPLKIKDENKNSLGSPIGLVTSNVNFKTEGKAADIVKARYATYLKAFARLYLNDEREWDSLLLDDIMKEGLGLYTDSQSKQSDAEVQASDIYMSHEQEVPREFQLSGFTFHVELMPKTSSTESGGKGDGVEWTLDAIMPALKSFIRKHQYGLLKVGSFYAMIWRSRDAYFVFDACGRRLTDFQADKENGVVMLMCFKSLENVRHLINNLSGLPATEPLIIRELKMVKVVTPQGNIMQMDYSLRNHQYEVVNDDYAYLKSDLHLTLNKADLLRNRSGLPVAVTAIVVSKIDHPATWDLKMVDRIICFGVNFCQSCWMKCKSTEDIDVDEFPTTFVVGQFHINIEIKSHFYEGIWHCVPASKHSELANALKNAFNAKHDKLILQINYQMYAIWRKQDFIYLLDPYRHRIMGKQNESKMYEEMEKSASVRMFRSFEVFMNVLNHILLDSNRTSRFWLHFVKVKNIQTLHKAKPGQVREVREPQHDEFGEIVSLNESICFEEAEDLCRAALGDISDYEDDDLRSDVVEMELRTSSSEEDLLEEEEARAGEVGEMEDIESSSSGEEGGVHKKKTSSSKRFGKGSAAKRKESKKGGGNKNKKGKGAKDSENEGDEDDLTKTGKSKKSGKKHKEKKGGKIDPNDDSKQKREPETEISSEDPDKVQEKHSDKQKTDSKEVGKGKDTNRTKDKGGEKGSSKDRDESEYKKPSRETDVNPGKDKELKKRKDLDKDKDKDKSNDLNKDKELNKSKDLKKPQDLAKDEQRVPRKDEKLTEVKQLNREKDLTKDEHISKVKDQKKDEDNSKEFNQEKSLTKDKTRNEVKDEDLNKPGQSESKPDPSKSELDDEKDTNKENEIFQSSHRFVDGKDSTGDKDKAAEVQRDKLVDRFKARTERLIEKSPKEACGKKYDGDDENQETADLCSTPKPNRYPGYLKYPVDMAVVGSESGSYQSICKLFQAGFREADRLLLMTYWGNFVIFRCTDRTDPQQNHYYLFDGCTCNFNRFRHFDLSVGTAGLIYFQHLHNIIEYIRHLRRSRSHKQSLSNNSADNICKEYGNKSFILRV